MVRCTGFADKIKENQKGKEGSCVSLFHLLCSELAEMVFFPFPSLFRFLAASKGGFFCFPIWNAKRALFSLAEMSLVPLCRYWYNFPNSFDKFIVFSTNCKWERGHKKMRICGKRGVAALLAALLVGGVFLPTATALAGPAPSLLATADKSEVSPGEGVSVQLSLSTEGSQVAIVQLVLNTPQTGWSWAADGSDRWISPSPNATVDEQSNVGSHECFITPADGSAYFGQTVELGALEALAGESAPAGAPLAADLRYTLLDENFAPLGEEERSLVLPDVSVFAPAPPAVTGLAVEKLPDKTLYLPGEEPDLTGGLLRVDYGDGTSAQLPMAEADCDIGAVGEGPQQQIALTYQGQSVSLSVGVRQPQGLTVQMLPDKTRYAVGEGVDLTGGLLSADYGDGLSLPVQMAEATSSGYDSTRVGEQLVTLRWKGFAVSFSVTVDGGDLQSIALATLPDKTVYQVGETFDPAGGVLRLEYAGGGWAERPLSVELCQAAAFDSPGEKSVLVTLEGKTTSFAVAVADNPVTGLVLLSLPQRLTYQLGEELVVAGGRLQVCYQNGDSSELELTLALCSPTRFTQPGSQTVTVTYLGQSAVFTVQVEPRQLTGIALAALPAKTIYRVGEPFDPTGGSVALTYSDGGKEVRPLTAEMVSGFDSTAPGEPVLTVSVEGQTTTFSVQVLPEEQPWSLSFAVLPAKSSYLQGQPLDPSGGVLLLSRGEEQRRVPLSAEMCSRYRPQLLGVQMVSIACEDGRLDWPVTVLSRARVDALNAQLEGISLEDVLPEEEGVLQALLDQVEALPPLEREGLSDSGLTRLKQAIDRAAALASPERVEHFDQNRLTVRAPQGALSWLCDLSVREKVISEALTQAVQRLRGERAKVWRYYQLEVESAARSSGGFDAPLEVRISLDDLADPTTAAVFLVAEDGSLSQCPLQMEGEWGTFVAPVPGSYALVGERGKEEEPEIGAGEPSAPSTPEGGGTPSSGGSSGDSAHTGEEGSPALPLVLLLAAALVLPLTRRSRQRR